ncbi:recombinase family protein [Pseudomonas jinjuensis]|uniref:Putative DNA-invertase from lambdoid prophage Rac n=1 Tax=Pseudomonas jinjuensis TaxID=198616 RepID=A0A1H0BMT6_9PSED|nr:recombinase family protein [Pseudomonas jinjuensis]SDN46959.1 putative DNA-invertase from lambdoid prophage Rac [Pseudomonas jinjuensis]
MNRLFAYGRVSTLEQSTDNQLLALQQKGFDIQPHRWFAEQASGGMPALQRLEFSKMADRMEAGDMLVVLKLDRLGRDVQDVLATIEALSARSIHVRSLDLDGVDLASAAGKLQLTVLAAVAAFERDRIKERTREGLARSSKKAGRPEALNTTKAVQTCKVRGMSQSLAAAELGMSLATIKRHWNK